jgi:tRNA-Thr(GGU) m(6)t(6)A37 methyltransferase TsaA
MDINLITIGTAKNKHKEKYGEWDDVVTEIVINKKYQKGLYKLSDFSHIQVIFYLHKVNEYKLHLVPQDKIGIVPEVGVFATRTQYRPNPIGISIVKILKIDNNIITVKGLDVINNTPIIDIKPYIPDKENTEFKTPEWVKNLK